MIRYLWRSAAGYRLKPWRSPYLRWRLETYWGLEAEHITAPQFLSFCWQHRAELYRFLKWADRMQARTGVVPRFEPGRRVVVAQDASH